MRIFSALIIFFSLARLGHAADFKLKLESMYGFSSNAENQRGLSGYEVSTALKAGFENVNLEYGLGIEASSRTLLIGTPSSKNSALGSSDLSYTVDSFPFYVVGYLPLQNTWFRPGLELAAYYVLTNKSKQEQDLAFSVTPLLRFNLSKHLDLNLRFRYLQPMGSTGSLPGTSLMDNGRFGAGAGLGYRF